MLGRFKVRLTSKTRTILYFIGFIVLLVGLGIGVYLVQQRQLFRQRASTSNVDLTMVPNSTTVAPNDTFTISISMIPNGNSVSVASVVVNYPASGLTLQSVEPGPFFMKNFNSTTTEMLNKIDTSTAGTATIILGAPCTNQSPWICYPNSSTDTYAILHFKAQAASTNSVIFSSSSEVAAVGNNENVVGDMSGAQVIVYTPTSSPITSPPASPGTATLNFKIKFQGISVQKADQKVKITLKNGQTFDNVNVTSNSSGVYSGSITGITPGAYEVLVKGPHHLQKNFGSVAFTANQANSVDWSGTTILAGDVDGTNFINSVDIGMVIEDYFPDTPAGSAADFNLDGTVNSVDIGFVIENYFMEGDK